MSRLEFPGVAVITGGGSGIGAAAAKAFASAGCTRIAITDIDAASLQQTKQAIEALCASVQVVYSVGDISEPVFVDRFMDEIFQTWSRIDYAVNCAGILLAESKRSLDTPVADFERINDVNYKGCWLSSRAQIRQMLRQEPLAGHSQRGAIVNISSQLGFVARPGAAYCGSKAAIINMTRADAVDYSDDGIRLNCVCPGVIKTPMTTATEELHRALDKKVLSTPLKRMGSVDEVADSILFLCSNMATFIQGHALVVDGGYTIT